MKPNIAEYCQKNENPGLNITFVPEVSLRKIIVPLTLATSSWMMGDAAMAVSLNLVAQPQSVQIGSTVTVAVQVSGLGNFSSPSLSGYDLNLNFNPGIFQFTGINFGDPTLGNLVDLSDFDINGVDTSTAGVVNFFEISLDDEAALNSAQPSAFTLATLNFRAISAGSSPLSLSVNELLDEASDPLSLTSPPTAITIEAVPEPNIGILSYGLLFGIGSILKNRLSKTQRNEQN